MNGENHIDAINHSELDDKSIEKNYGVEDQHLFNPFFENHNPFLNGFHTPDPSLFRGKNGEISFKEDLEYQLPKKDFFHSFDYQQNINDFHPTHTNNSLYVYPVRSQHANYFSPNKIDFENDVPSHPNEKDFKISNPLQEVISPTNPFPTKKSRYNLAKNKNGEFIFEIEQKMITPRKVEKEKKKSLDSSQDHPIPLIESPTDASPVEKAEISFINRQRSARNKKIFEEKRINKPIFHENKLTEPVPFNLGKKKVLSSEYFSPFTPTSPNYPLRIRNPKKEQN